MDISQGLSWKTRSGAGPQGRPRVYLCCHPDDFGWVFEQVCDEILGAQPGAAVWYHGPSAGVPDPQGLLDDLSAMQLFVVPVTSSFLYRPSGARDDELTLALKRHIPVLPLMMERGLDEGYGRVLGDLQHLDRRAPDKGPAAMPYEERLARYLSSVLVGDELAERVRAAFDAYVFLSYRKRDRAAAQRVMRLIHDDPLCQGVAVWYDEFLVPGEGFNRAILDAIRRCSAFALVVTPSLLEVPNYVLGEEYPAARSFGKPVVPVEAEETDGTELVRLYAGLGRTVSVEDREAVARCVRDALSGVALAASASDPEHGFLVGLAYLMGIDVEVDHERALSLITSAADAGLPEAYERLVAMYNTGEGVGRDYRRAIVWQERLVEVLRERSGDGRGAAAWRGLYSALSDLGDYRMAVGDPEGARVAYEEMLQCAEELNDLECSGALRELSVAIGKCGDARHAMGELENALSLYVRSSGILGTLAEETGEVEARRAYSASLSLCGDALLEQGHPVDALALFERSLGILEPLAEETGTLEVYRDLSESLCLCGDAHIYLREPEAALALYERSIGVREVLAKETGAAQARRDLSVALAQAGDARRFLGDIEGALALYERSLPIFRALAQETGTMQARRDLSMALGKAGDARLSLGDSGGALDLFSQALALDEAIVGEATTTQAWDGLASSHYNLGLIRLLPASDRRVHLEMALAIGERLLEQTGSPRYEMILRGAREQLAVLDDDA